MAGKGDGRRPRFVSDEEWNRRWERAFGGGEGFDEQVAPHAELGSDSGSTPDTSMRQDRND